MKRFFSFGLTIILGLAVTLSGCGGGGDSGGSGGGNTSGGNGDTSIYKVGDSSEYKVGTTSSAKTFKMNFVPAKTFRTETDDFGQGGSVGNGYWMGETEVTYDLWKKIYDWATKGTDGSTTSTSAGAGQYKFANIGEGSTAAVNYPVYKINWRDAMVWCNAATEYYNATNNKSDICVYTTNGKILRDATDTTNCDAVEAGSNTTGFRLPSSMEWELAARYINDKDGDNLLTENGEYYPGNYASGADAIYNASSSNGDIDDNGYRYYSSNVAVYGKSSPMNVGSLKPNKLKLFDMSGNVAEWCFDRIGSNRIYRGGAYDGDQASLQIGNINSAGPFQSSSIGLRLVKNVGVSGGSNISNTAAFGSVKIKANFPATHCHEYFYHLKHRSEDHNLSYYLTIISPDSTNTHTLSGLSAAQANSKSLNMLKPGKWTIKAQGRCGDWVNCTGEATVEVVSGQTVTVTIPVTIVASDH